MRRAPLIGLVVALLLAIAFWFLLYQPQRDKQAAVEAETAQLVSQQGALRNQIVQLESIAANEPAIRAALADLEELIPFGPAQPTMIRQLQLAADAAGVEILQVTFSPPELAEGAPATADPTTVLAQIPMTMTLDGGYFQVTDFFRRVEVDVPRAVLVDNIAIDEGEDGYPSLSTSWGGSVFAVVPRNSIEGAQAAPVPPPAPAPPAPGSEAGATPAPTTGGSPAPSLPGQEGGPV